MTELSSFQSRFAEEAQVKLREITALSESNNVAKINEFTSRVNRLQDGITINGCSQTRSTANQQVVGEPNPCSRSSVTHAGISNTINVVSDCSQCENDVGLNACASRESDLHAACVGSNPQSSHDVGRQHEIASRNDLQWHSSLISDVSLTMFRDATKQNAVQLLCELDSYFTLKRVTDSLKLPTAKKAICDEYAKQWMESVKKDMRNYEDCKRDFTELLWNATVQSGVRNVVYQGKYSKKSGESFSPHFLRYSVQSAYVVPRMSEIDLVSAISSHFPAYVNRALLSANITKIQGALTFLRRLEALETQDAGPGRVELCAPRERGNRYTDRQQNCENPAHDRPPHGQRNVRHITNGISQVSRNNSW